MGHFCFLYKYIYIHIYIYIYINIYNKNDKESLRYNARDKYRNLSNIGKDKKSRYGRYMHHNMPKEKKKNNNLKRMIVRLRSLSLVVSEIVF